MVQGSNPGGGTRFSTFVQTGPGAHQPTIQWVPGLFPGVKRPGSGVDHPPPSSAEVKKKWSYTSTPPVDLRGLLQGELYFYLHI